MPYVLKEESTGQLLACMQVNGYQLPYYGILLWESVPHDTAAAEAVARADAAGPADGWKPVELTEHQAKMANVKLRNDPRRRVFLQGETLSASLSEV